MLKLHPGKISAFIHVVGLGFRFLFLSTLMRISTPQLIGLYSVAASIEAISVYLVGFEFHTFTSRRYAKSPSYYKLRLIANCHARLFFLTIPLSSVTTCVFMLTLNMTTDIWIALCTVLIVICAVVSQETVRLLILTRQPIHSVCLAFIRTAVWQPFAVFILGSEQFLGVKHFFWIEHLLGTETLGSRAIFTLWSAFSFIAMLWSIWLLRGLWSYRIRIRIRYLTNGIARAKYYYVGAVANVLLSSVERLVLQTLLGPEAVGIYSFFQTLANTSSTLIQTAVLNIALPNLLEKFSRKAKSRFEYLYSQLHHTARIAVGVGILIVLVAFPIVWIIDRSAYIEQLWILPLLLFGQGLISWTQPIHLALYAAHHDRLLITLMVSALLLALCLNYLSISKFGLPGAVIAPLATALALTNFRWLFFKRLTKQGAI
ncbi:MAG: oligosaccharide flippase family protein [Methylococcaceae bacterium]|nr:oligosaccharide flippase family protein [Methylococcaceae bacterium]